MWEINRTDGSKKEGNYLLVTERDLPGASFTASDQQKLEISLPDLPWEVRV